MKRENETKVLAVKFETRTLKMARKAGRKG
jgi:hypothetical protein